MPTNEYPRNMGERGEIESAIIANAAGARYRLMHGETPPSWEKPPRPVSPFVREMLQRRRAAREAFERQMANRSLGIVGETDAGSFGWPPYAPPAGYDICMPVGASRRRLTMREIIEEVALKYGVRVIDMKSSRRTRDLVVPRQEAMYRCAKETMCSLPQIGRAFGGRDHTTVLHSVRMHEKRMREAVNG